MSPLVRRSLEVPCEVTKGTIRTTQKLYVPPGKVRQGDVVVKPTRRQREELAERYPDEFGAGATQASPPAPPAPPRRGAQNDDPGDDAVADFAQLNATSAADRVLSLDPAEPDDLAKLGAFFEAELSRDPAVHGYGPRKTVLEAFALHGMVPPTEGGDEDEDEE